jgi:hypothetical protein
MENKAVSSIKLKNYLDTKKRDSRLMGSIERHILSKPFEERNQKVLHPSDIIKPEWCALAAYHALNGNYVETRERPTLRLQSIFDTGHGAHAKWQGYLREMGVLYGKWYSHKNKDYTWATSKDVRGITTRDLEYQEVPLHSAKHMISGHSDGWVKGLGEDFLIEIKTIGAGTIRMEAPGLFSGGQDVESAWRNIRQPFSTHILQGQVYLHLAHLMVEAGDLPSAPNEIVFIYELKANQDYKEFTVAYEPKHSARFFENALDVAWAVENKRPPVCTVDPVLGCTRCKPFRGENA